MVVSARSCGIRHGQVADEVVAQVGGRLARRRACDARAAATVSSPGAPCAITSPGWLSRYAARTSSRRRRRRRRPTTASWRGPSPIASIADRVWAANRGARSASPDSRLDERLCQLAVAVLARQAGQRHQHGGEQRLARRGGVVGGVLRSLDQRLAVVRGVEVATRAVGEMLERPARPGRVPRSNQPASPVAPYSVRNPSATAA